MATITLTPDFIGRTLDMRTLYNANDGVEVGFIHEGGGDVTVYLFDEETGDVTTSALCHLKGEGQ